MGSRIWIALRFCAALPAIVISSFSVHAQQDLTWDANGPAAGTGGTGTWNTTSAFWFNGTTFQAWNNATFDNAIFAGTAGNVSLGTPISVHNLTFNVGGYLFPTVGTLALTFGGVNPTVTTNVGTTQFFFPLTGSTGFTKSGAGTLQLGGTSVGYTGVTTVDAGTLAVSNSLALGFGTAASKLVLNNGATIAIFSPSFDYNYTLTGGVVNMQMTGINNLVRGSPTLTASTTLTLNGTGTTGTLSASLADTGANILSVTKSNTSRVILSGNNTYTGPTTVSRGRLQLNSAGALSSGSNLIFSGAVGTGGSIELTSNFGDFTRGLGTGAGHVQWLGDGGFLSSGSGRIVNIGGAGAILTWGAGGFVPTGNRLILGTSSNHLLDFQNAIDLSGGVRAVQGDGGLISGYARISGILSGTGGINQVGNGFLELTAANTYTGGTVMTSGIVIVGSNANLGDAAGTLTFGGGTLQNTGAFTAARSVTINAPGGTFWTDADLGVSGPIVGAGRLTKTGVASLTLSGTGTYTGGTTISAGTLQIGNGGTSGSIVGNVIDNGVLALNRSGTLILDGAISGTGRLEQRGAGTTILTGGSTYLGGTTISAGTLQIGNGGTTGSLSGNVVNNGVIAFSRSDALTFAGVIGGNGRLEQRGGGTLILTSANTYTGGTTISAGILQIGGGGTTGSLLGNVTNNGVLAFNRSDALTFGGVISGIGSLEQRGTGRLTLTANSFAFTGNTSILAGTLVVNGVLGGSLDVRSSGRLQGAGTVGATAVAPGGTLAPGAPNGTLTVAGNISFAQGSFFEVNTDATGIATLLHATGAATLAGGTVRVVTGAATVFRTGARYSILTADAGRSGQFSAVVETLPLYNLTLAYDPKHVFLDVARNSTTLCSLAVTRNQCAISTADTSIGAGNLVVDAVRSLPDVASIRNALDLLSGEIHPSTKTVLLENSRFVRDAVIDRLRQTSGLKTDSVAGNGADDRSATERAVWGRVFGSFGSQNGDGNAARIGKSVGGFFAGADTSFAERFHLGVAIGHANSSFNVNERASSGSSKDYHLALYGAARWDHLGLRVGAAYTWHDVRTERRIVFPGFSAVEKTNYNAHTAQAFGEAGYTLVWGGLALEPFARLAHVRLITASFDESAGPAALRASRQAAQITYTTLGVHAARTFALSDRSIAIARATVGWRQALGDILPLSTMAAGTSSNFIIAGVPISKHALVVEAGLAVIFAGNATLGVSYYGQISRGAEDHGLRADFTWRF